jgi:uncharacterized protein YeaO (DUF488 family)
VRGGTEILVQPRRVYDTPSPESSYTVLIDRLWPRGIKKESIRIDIWAKDLAPSDHLRKWFSHDPEKWDNFRELYRKELCDPKKIEIIESIIMHKDITLLYASKETVYNNAEVFKEILEHFDEFRNNCSENRIH